MNEKGPVGPDAWIRDAQKAQQSNEILDQEPAMLVVRQKPNQKFTKFAKWSADGARKQIEKGGHFVAMVNQDDAQAVADTCCRLLDDKEVFFVRGSSAEKVGVLTSSEAVAQELGAGGELQGALQTGLA